MNVMENLSNCVVICAVDNRKLKPSLLLLYKYNNNITDDDQSDASFFTTLRCCSPWFLIILKTTFTATGFNFEKKLEIPDWWLTVKEYRVITKNVFKCILFSHLPAK